MDHKIGLVHKLVSLALVLVLLALIAQACGGKEKEVTITPLLSISKSGTHFRTEHFGMFKRGEEAP
jgi:hypothetical protein